VCWPRFRAHTNHRVSHFTFGAANKSALLNFARYHCAPRATVWLRFVIENTSARDRPLIAIQRPNDKPANVCEKFFISSLSFSLSLFFSLLAEKKRNNPICSFQLSTRANRIYARDRSQSITFCTFSAQIDVARMVTQYYNI